MLKSLAKGRIAEIVVILLSAILIFAPIYYSEIYLGAISDFPAHIGWAKDIFLAPQNVPSNVIAHGGWEWLVYLTKSVFNIGWQGSALLITLASDLATTLILFMLLRNKFTPLLAGSLTLGIMLIGPLVLFFPFDNNWYPGGYVWSNIYHNPTSLLLRPFALLQFIFTYHALAGKKSNWLIVLLLALVSLAAAFAKPSYIICLLPALSLLALKRMIKKEPTNWLALLLGIVMPSVAILVWQYLLTYSASSPSQIAIAPFSVMRYFSNNLAPKFILSIAFPATVTLAFWREAIKDERIQLGWLTFAVGSIYMYLLAEMGSTYEDGNFIFSAEMSLFMLLVGCMFFIADKKLPSQRLGRWVILAVGFLQVFFGVSYFFFKLYH